MNKIFRSFIHLVDVYSTVLGIDDTIMNNTDRNCCPHGTLHFSWGDMISKINI